MVQGASWLREHPLKRTRRLLIAALQKQDATDLIKHHAVARVLLSRCPQMLERFVIIAVGLERERVEEVRLGKFRIYL